MGGFEKFVLAMLVSIGLVVGLSVVAHTWNQDYYVTKIEGYGDLTPARIDVSVLLRLQALEDKLKMKPDPAINIRLEKPKTE